MVGGAGIVVVGFAEADHVVGKVAEVGGNGVSDVSAKVEIVNYLAVAVYKEIQVSLIGKRNGQGGDRLPDLVPKPVEFQTAPPPPTVVLPDTFSNVMKAS